MFEPYFPSYRPHFYNLLPNEPAEEHFPLPKFRFFFFSNFKK